jgi:hypothetical protein
MMNRRKLTKLSGAFALLAVSSLAAVAFATESPTLVCGPTGKEAQTCCCEQKEGKLVCRHTGKVLEKCCCTTK